MNDHGYVPFVVFIVESVFCGVMDDPGYVSFVEVMLEPGILWGNE
jgi:hypothetical protein